MWLSAQRRLFLSHRWWVCSWPLLFRSGSCFLFERHYAPADFPAFCSGYCVLSFTTIKINRADIAGLKMKRKTGLVSVTDVPNNSPAQRMGFKKGDTC
jgi:hypothetical protein